MTVAKMTKKAINQLQVAERKSMREKQKNSAFIRKTASIYKGMCRRAGDMKPPQSVGFSLEMFREFCRTAMGLEECWYCGGNLKIANLAIDHDIPISRGGSFEFVNLHGCCKSCNWQKGIMTGIEFAKFLVDLSPLPSAVQADIKRRLTIGGKWGVRV